MRPISSWRMNFLDAQLNEEPGPYRLGPSRSANSRSRPGMTPVQWLVGVNCRDLSTLQIVPGRLERLAPLLPTQVPRVAESGVATAADAGRIAAAGYDMALVGSALMSSADPRALAPRDDRGRAACAAAVVLT